MQLFKHFTANDEYLEPFPFKRELSMQAYLIENEKVLSLDRSIFSNVEIIDVEVPVLEARNNNTSDGRIDVLATYSQEYIAIIELKLGCLEEAHLNQLQDYLSKKEKLLMIKKNILELALGESPKWIGMLVGSSIDPEFAKKIKNGDFLIEDTPIAALTLQRFRSTTGNVYVTTDTYFNSRKVKKDSTEYIFEGKSYGKGRLALTVLKRFIENNPNLTFSELEADDLFPQSCQGTSGLFKSEEKAKEILESTNRKRHFLEQDEIIKLIDVKIAISNQWGIGNINKFIETARKHGFEIREKIMSEF